MPPIIKMAAVVHNEIMSISIYLVFEFIVKKNGLYVSHTVAVGITLKEH